MFCLHLEDARAWIRRRHGERLGFRSHMLDISEWVANSKVALVQGSLKSTTLPHHLTPLTTFLPEIPSSSHIRHPKTVPVDVFVPAASVGA